MGLSKESKMIHTNDFSLFLQDEEVMKLKQLKEFVIEKKG